VSIEDEWPGLPETSNLFVPFFTTKPSGSGIGLALSRQIAESARRDADAGKSHVRARLPRGPHSAELSFWRNSGTELRH
jgi:signal transduction histidine kinase